MDAAEVLALPSDELLLRARQTRDRAFGRRVTYSPKVFIPLTMLCRDKCGYCTFAQPPARLAAPYLSPDDVARHRSPRRRGRLPRGAVHARRTPGGALPVAAEWLDDARLRIDGRLSRGDVRARADRDGPAPPRQCGRVVRGRAGDAAAVSASQGMMIESLRDDLECHRGSPDKTPERRLATLEAAGKLSIPFTTGILVGIGENREDRAAALVAIAESHARHGHVQEVIVQNFLPKDGTAMHNAPPCPHDEYLDAIALARLLLPADVHVQAPPNLSDDFGVLLDAGIDDWGGVSPVTADHVNPERPWPALDRLREVTEAKASLWRPG